MSSERTLVKTPGARSSLSNQDSYLYIIPLINSFLTLKVKFSPAIPIMLLSTAFTTAIAQQVRTQYITQLFLSVMYVYFGTY